MPWLRLALLLALCHLALAHARFGDTLALLGPLLLAPSLRGLCDGPLSVRTPAGTSAALGLGLVAVLLLTDVGSLRTIDNDEPRIAPHAALGAAGPGLVFNDYDFGGFLIFSGIAPFVDGRLDLYGDRFMRDYMSALEAEGDALPELLARFDVGWTILKPFRPAVAQLDRLPGWRRAFADEDVVVHVRTGP